MSQITSEIVAQKLNTRNKDALHLDLSNGGYNSISTGALDRCAHLKTLDLSNNSFTTIDDELTKLIHLECLNLSGNSLRFPCKYLKKLPWLQELSITSNPMSKEQQMYAVYFIPSLVKLNGMSVDEARSALTKRHKSLQDKIELFWRSKKATRSQVKWKEYKMECLRKFKSIISAADKFKLLYSEQLDDLIHEASSVWFEKAVEQIQMNGDAENNCKVKYAPEVFIRCHCAEDNLNDCTSEVSAVIFMSDSSSPSKSLLASAGGNSICLIDPTSSQVVARYMHSIVSEEFTCLTYTVNSDDETILAASTKSGHINLINVSSLTCYFRWKSHDQRVTCLSFHPSKHHVLFSSSLDKCIRIWNISDDELTRRTVAPMTTIKFDDKIRTFVFSPEIDLLLAASERAVHLATNIFQYTPSGRLIKRSTRKTSNISSDISPSKSKRRKNRSLSASVLLNCDENFNDKFASNLVKSHINLANIDSFAILPSHPGYVAVKCCKEGKILIWSLGHLKNALIAPDKSQQLLNVKSFYTLKFTETAYASVQLTACDKLLACGDEDGRVWMYSVDECLENAHHQEEDEERAPAVMYAWPTPDFGDEKKLSSVPDARVKCITISYDLRHFACATDVNLICLWKMCE